MCFVYVKCSIDIAEFLWAMRGGPLGDIIVKGVVCVVGMDVGTVIVIVAPRALKMVMRKNCIIMAYAKDIGK